MRPTAATAYAISRVGKGTFDQQPMEFKLAAARAACGRRRRRPEGVEGEKFFFFFFLVFALTSQGTQRLELRVTSDEIKGKAPSFETTIAATFNRDVGSQRTEENCRARCGQIWTR